MEMNASWKKVGTLGLMLLVGSISTRSLAESPGTPKGTKTWHQKMRNLEHTFQELLIDLSSDERFSNPKNFKKIEKNAEAFSKYAHDLKSKDGPSPDADPSIPMIADQFSSEADRAYKTLKWGHREYARSVLKSMTGYCIACHTRSGGAAFQNISVAPGIQSLGGLERANFFAATRQFDRGLEEYERVIGEARNSERRPFDWERAVRSGLAIAVRVKKDPARALNIVDQVLNTPTAPFFLREQASQWKISLNSWKSEPPAKVQTEEGYFTLALRLIADAKAFQKYPADRSADILYLRASSAVHDLMSFAPNGKRATDALYLAGLCYEVLHDLNLWDIHEFYYLACILKSPHTGKSRECYRQYERSIYLGYTGSGGTDIPNEIRKKLIKLDQMSTPLEEKTGVKSPL